MSNRFIPERQTPLPGTEQDAQAAALRASAPPVPVCTPTQIAIATFLGSPIAGGIALAFSHKNARTGRGASAVLMGIGLTVVVVVLYMALGPLGVIATVAGIVAMRGIAVQQMPGIEEAAGARIEEITWWLPIGVAVLTLIGLVVLGGLVGLVAH